MTMPGSPRGGLSSSQGNAAINPFPDFFSCPPASVTAFSALSGANRGIFVRLERAMAARTIAKLRLRFNTQSGNYDVGLFSSDGTTLTRVASMGSQAVPAAGVATNTLAASIVQAAGGDYYATLTLDNAVATFLVGAGIRASDAGGIGGRVYLSVPAVFPLPATVLISSLIAGGVIPYIVGGPT